MDSGEELGDGKGKIHTAQFHAIEDEYFAWWLKNEFKDRPASRRGETTVYRNPIHVDVFRVLPGEAAAKVSWLKKHLGTCACKAKVETEKSEQTKELEDVLKKRKTDEGGRNVLRITRDASSGKKKTKKKKKK